MEKTMYFNTQEEITQWVRSNFMAFTVIEMINYGFEIAYRCRAIDGTLYKTSLKVT